MEPKLQCKPYEYFSLINSSRVARMSCERATLRAMSDKLVTFRNLREGLVASREAFVRSSEWDDTMNAGLMALRWTKALCDAFISMAASASGGEKADVVKGVYEASASVLGAVSAASHGGQVDHLAVAQNVKDGLIGAAGKKVDLASKVVNLNVNIAIDAARKDDTALLVRATGDQLAMKSRLVAQWSKDLNKQGTTTFANSLAMVTEIMMAGVKLERALSSANDAYLKNQDEIRSRHHSVTSTMNNQLYRIESRIYLLESQIDACIVATE